MAGRERLCRKILQNNLTLQNEVLTKIIFMKTIIFLVAIFCSTELFSQVIFTPAPDPLSVHMNNLDRLNGQQQQIYVPQPVKQPTYSDGWNTGYKQGWCYGLGAGCYPAYPPYPPYPRYGEDSYQGGYNRGFLQALNDRGK